MFLNKDQALVDVLLGRSWMCSTNCQLNWISQRYTLQVTLVNLAGPRNEPTPLLHVLEDILVTHTT